MPPKRSRGYLCWLWAGAHDWPSSRPSIEPDSIPGRASTIMRPGGNSAVTLTTSSAAGVEVRGPRLPGFDRVLTPEALEFVARLHREFNPTREALLAARRERQARFD